MEIIILQSNIINCFKFFKKKVKRLICFSFLDTILDVQKFGMYIKYLNLELGHHQSHKDNES